jgi:hypothetical protein
MKPRSAATTNLDIAAWLSLQGLELLEVDARSSRARFLFADPHGRAENLTWEYWGSKVAKFVSARIDLRRALRHAQASPTGCSTFDDATRVRGETSNG